MIIYGIGIGRTSLYHIWKYDYRHAALIFHSSMVSSLRGTL